MMMKAFFFDCFRNTQFNAFVKKKIYILEFSLNKNY